MSSSVDNDIQRHDKSRLTKQFRNMLILLAEVNGQPCQVLVDTGATCSLLPPSVTLTVRNCPPQSITGIYGTNTTQQQAEVKVRFSPQHKPIIYLAYVLDVPRPILGNDFLRNNKVSINYFRQEITIGNQHIPFYLNSAECMSRVSSSKPHKLTVPQDTVLPSRSTTLIKLPISKRGLLTPFVKTMETYNLIIPEILYPDKGQIEVPILNLNKYPVTLNAHTCLGHIEDVDDIQHTNYEFNSFCYAASSSSPSFEFKINPELSSAQREQLLKLLHEYSDVFATSEHDTGLYNGPEMVRLNTGDSAPISSPPYRKSHTESKVIQKHIKGLLEKGIIRESNSDWASPVLLVSKPDGGVRLCIDYRRLNQVLKDDKFPMGRLDDLFDCLHGTKYFSKLDIQSGFYNFQIHEDDREKTAFITHEGLYEFNRVPFGLRTSPAVFNRMMRKIFGKLMYSRVFIYVDDLLVYGRSFDEHLNSLKEVFNKLLANNLKLKSSKCSFGFSQVKLLGHIVGKNGISVDPEKVEAIQRIPIPTTPTEVKSILGLASFYRRFIPHFSDISRPLSNLTKKAVKFVWTQTCQRAFDLLKDRLMSSPVLTQFDESLPVILYTDSSNYAVGALLCQIQNGVERVIAYASRLMNPSEQNFTTSEKECLALIFALEKWREYCYGRKIIAYTDHLALLSLVKTKNSKNLRLARWILSIQESDIELRYMRGKTLLHADALSRVLPFEEKQTIRVPSTVSYPDTQSVNNLVGIDYRAYLVESQQKDITLWSIRENLKIDPTHKSVQNYKLVNDILYYEDPIKHRLLICIPKNMVTEILYANHDHPMSGHLGIDKTYQKVKQKYYINNLKDYVYKYVRKCVECAKRSSNSYKKIGNLQAGEIYQLFDKIYIDTIGPLTETTRKNKHIIVCIDYFSKFVITKAIKSINAVTIAKFLMDHVFLMYGCSREIVMDNARIHHSKLMTELLAKVGTRPIYITPYHHQSNAVERVNRTLQESLSKYINSTQTDWDQHLPSCTFALNTAVHSSTQFSPYQVVFGRQPNLPIDILFDVPTIPYLENSQKVRAEVRENLLKAQQNYGAQYNAKRIERDYPINSKIMIADTMPKPGMSRKLSPKFMGPYRVIKQISPLNYIVASVNKPHLKSFVVHVNRMKPFGDTKLTPPKSSRPSSPIQDANLAEELYSSDESEDTSQFIFKPPPTSTQTKPRSNSHFPNSQSLQAMQRSRSISSPVRDQVPVQVRGPVRGPKPKKKPPKLKLPRPAPSFNPAVPVTTRSGRVVVKPNRYVA